MILQVAYNSLIPGADCSILFLTMNFLYVNLWAHVDLLSLHLRILQAHHYNYDCLVLESILQGMYSGSFQQC